MHSNALGTKQKHCIKVLISSSSFPCTPDITPCTGSGFAFIALWWCHQQVCGLACKKANSTTGKGYESSTLRHIKWLYNAIFMLRVLHWNFFSDQHIRVGFYLNAVLSNRVGLCCGWHSALLATLSCFQSLYSISAACEGDWMYSCSDWTQQKKDYVVFLLIKCNRYG